MRYSHHVDSCTTRDRLRPLCRCSRTFASDWIAPGRLHTFHQLDVSHVWLPKRTLPSCVLKEEALVDRRFSDAARLWARPTKAASFDFDGRDDLMRLRLGLLRGWSRSVHSGRQRSTESEFEVERTDSTFYGPLAGHGSPIARPWTTCEERLLHKAASSSTYGSY